VTRRLVAALGVLAIAGWGERAERSSAGGPSPAEDLVEAAGAGDVATVRRLLAAGADVDAQDAGGRTAVTAAALGEHLEVARLLIAAGADVDAQDMERNNALLACGQTGNLPMLRAVLAAGPDLRRTNRYGGTALLPAAERGHVGVVRELMPTGIAIDHVNRLGWTALLEAVILGDGGPPHRQIVRMLLDAGADVNVADREGVTPLEHARRRGYDDIARALVDAGAR
jgi:ankyrin repeat protein